MLIQFGNIRNTVRQTSEQKICRVKQTETESVRVSQRIRRRKIINTKTNEQDERRCSCTSIFWLYSFKLSWLFIFRLGCQNGLPAGTSSHIEQFTWRGFHSSVVRSMLTTTLIERNQHPWSQKVEANQERNRDRDRERIWNIEKKRGKGQDSLRTNA